MLKILEGAKAAIPIPIGCPYSDSYWVTIAHVLECTYYLSPFGTPIGNLDTSRILKHLSRHLSRPRIYCSYWNTFQEHQYESHIQSHAAYPDTYWTPNTRRIFKHLSRADEMCRLLNHLSRLWIHPSYWNSYVTSESSSISWCVFRYLSENAYTANMGTSRGRIRKPIRRMIAVEYRQAYWIGKHDDIEVHLNTAAARHLATGCPTCHAWRRICMRRYMSSLHK